jgi:hypothetical protein
MIDLKHLDAELREIEFMVLAVLDAAETIVADPQMASSAATLLVIWWGGLIAAVLIGEIGTALGKLCSSTFRTVTLW